MERFAVAVEEAVLEDLRRRLAATRWPEAGDGGLALDSARRLAAYWRDGYDWRAAEASLNSFEHFLVDGMHCICEGSGPPLLLMHGWPSSVWEFNRLIGLLRSDFTVIVPSLPGYGFSLRPRASIVEMADAMHSLMGALGHSRYLICAGDWGSSVACRLAYAYPDAVAGLHLYMMPIRRPSSIDDDAARAALDAWQVQEGGYGHIQGSKPQTLAYGLTDSPVGLMSWIAEKFETWTDSRGVSDDDVLTTTMIYWATERIGSSFWPYYTRLLGGDWVLDDVIAAGERLRAPLTYLDFPKELVHVPRSVVERVFDIERWEEPAYGGHFPALEVPDVLADSLRRFSR